MVWKNMDDAEQKLNFPEFDCKSVMRHQFSSVCALTSDSLGEKLNPAISSSVFEPRREKKVDRNTCLLAM